jgi:hypothetical protein
LSPPKREQDAVEDAIEERSLFEKIVNLVTPPSALPSLVLPSDGLQNHAVEAALDGGRETDPKGISDVSDAGTNATGAGKSEPSVNAAVEDATEQTSLFEKIVNLVKPPSAVPSVLNETDSGTPNESDAGANAAATGKAAPTVLHASERVDANSLGGGQTAAFSGPGAGSPIDIQVEAKEDEHGWDYYYTLEPVDIGPAIFPELIPSIKSPDDLCSDKCTINTCSGHGVCTAPLCKCKCLANYTGSYCHELVTAILDFKLTPPRKPCPDKCTEQGYCRYNGTCSCYKGWAGYNCSIECMGGVSNPCSGHGVCLQTSGKCHCSEGYAGKNCTRRSVPQDLDNYRKMVLLSESKEKEAKVAKENASKVERERGGASGGAGGAAGSDAGKKSEGDGGKKNEAANGTAADVVLGSAAGSLRPHTLVA